MKLKKIQFNHYKSILGEALDIEDDITCLVGINESGKSNVLLAISKADTSSKLLPEEYSRHSNNYGNTDNNPEIKLWLNPSKEEKNKTIDLFGHNELDTIILTKVGDQYRLDYPRIDYQLIPTDEEKTDDIESSEVSEIADETEVNVEIKKEEVRTKIISILKESLPKFLIFDSVAFDEYFLPENGELLISELIASPQSNIPVRNLLKLGGINDFSLIEASSETERIRRDKILGDASKKINEEILRVVWPIKSVEVKLGAEGDILKIRLIENGKTSPFMPMERSRGLQWALAFNIYFLAEATSNDRNKLENTVLLIDEPGIFLHIDAQKKLLENTFRKITSSNNQIVYTTHLPYLIDSRYPERIRILRKKDENTVIGNKAWSEGEFGKIPEPVKTALGLKWSEMFNIGEKNIVVEGPSDQLILRQLLELFSKTNDYTILPAYGYNKFPSILAIWSQ